MSTGKKESREEQKRTRTHRRKGGEGAIDCRRGDGVDIVQDVSEFHPFFTAVKVPFDTRDSQQDGKDPIVSPIDIFFYPMEYVHGSDL